MALPVLDTRKVLLEHLLSKLTAICSTKLTAKKILLEVSNNLQNKDILRLLQDDKLLAVTVNKFHARTAEKEELGEQLYFKIITIEPEICSKITGMLMELDTSTIKKLLDDNTLLQNAIDKSKKEYLEFTCNSKKREVYGEQIYSLVCKHHKPEVASRLTGMLLELDEGSLSTLLVNRKEFEKKLEIAYNTFVSYCSIMRKHQELADFIKGVHINLRLRAREVGAEAAWKEHCKDRKTLEKYANAMRELATVHWEKNSRLNSDQSGIFWVNNKCNWYFFGDGKNLFLEKEAKMAARYSLDCDLRDSFVGPKVNLLDVGSCYNPLSQFPCMVTTAVDLEPASADVLKCDFLSVEVGDKLSVDCNSVCIQLPIESYDAVLFSLLLEYMPSPSQRFSACQKATRLLKKGGLLLVLTPDSKHASANSRLVRQWRLALSSLGLWMLETEKLKHLRCFTFCKAHDKRIVTEWLALQEVGLPPEEAVAIPQDKNPYDEIYNRGRELDRSDTDNNHLAETFSQIVGEADIFM